MIVGALLASLDLEDNDGQPAPEFADSTAKKLIDDKFEPSPTTTLQSV